MHRFPRPVSSLAALSVAALTGCVSNPARGTDRTEEPLLVRVESRTGTAYQDVVTGRKEHYDSAGNFVGETNNVETVAQTYNWTDWSFYQGERPLDEQDFFRLSLDQEAYEEIKAARAAADRNQKWGMGLAIGGTIGSLGSYYAFNETGSTVALASSVALSLASSAGYYLWLKGRTTMAKKHLVEVDRATAAAEVVERCNGSHCVTVTDRRAAGGAPPPAVDPE
jgi:hypothetical protein